MADPRMFIPRKYEYTTTARDYYIDGWRDGFEGRPVAYSDPAAAVTLVLDKGRAVLQAYTDGYKAGQAARE
jgi:ribosome modulation factor